MNLNEKIEILKEQLNHILLTEKPFSKDEIVDLSKSWTNLFKSTI